MRSTRHSSRLKENFQNKFKNTLETALNLDDDDDFVRPPQAIRRDNPVNEVVVEEERTETEANIETSKVGVVIEIGSTTTKDYRGNSGAMAAKRVLETGGGSKSVEIMEVRSKRLFDRAPDFKRQNVGGVAVTSSPIQSNVGSVGVGPVGSFVKNKKEVVAVRRSPIKRNVGQVSAERVAACIKKKGGGLAVRKSPKKDPVYKRKVSKEYAPGLRRLPSRMTPSRVYAAIKTLSFAQKMAVKQMGFGSLLKLNIEKVPGLLNYHLLDRYDPMSSTILLENAIIEMTKDLVFDVMGLPNEGLDFSTLPVCGKDHPVLKEWCAQYDPKKYSAEAFVERIKSTTKDTKLFRLNFLTLFINTFIESTLSGTNLVSVVDKLVLVDDYASIDWCQYMISSLKSRHSYWRRDDKTCYYTGPQPLLMLAYFLCIRCDGAKVNKKIPFISHVDGDTLLKIEKHEIKHGGFGRGHIDDYKNHEGFVAEMEIDKEMEDVLSEFGDPEEYSAMLQDSYDKIITEKENMEDALKDGLKRFPKSETLQEWLERKRELFNEEIEVVDNDGDDKGDDESESGECGKGDDENDDSGNEVDIQSSPIRGVVDDEFNFQVRDHYETPLAGGVNVCTELTMTQFLETPGVLEELNEMVDSASEKLLSKGKEKIESDDKNGEHKGKGRNLAFELDKECNAKGKRPVKLPDNLHSPYMERVVRLSVKVKTEERNMCNAVFASNRDFGDAIWEIEDGEVLYQGYAYEFEEKQKISWIIIDCWAAYLNKMEIYRSKGSPLRVFLSTQFLMESMFDKSLLEINHIRNFDNFLRIYIMGLSIKPSFKDVGLVFIPIVNEDMYYLLCFDLRKPCFFIIDHVKRTGSITEIYGAVPNLLQKYFGLYLQSQHHINAKALLRCTPVVMKLAWQVKKSGPDCGLYVMRHMELYMGEGQGKWTCGLKGNKSDAQSFLTLRYKYLYKLLSAEWNIHKDQMTKDSEKFGELTEMEQTKLLQEAAETRKRKTEMKKMDDGF